MGCVLKGVVWHVRSLRVVTPQILIFLNHNGCLLDLVRLLSVAIEFAILIRRLEEERIHIGPESLVSPQSLLGMKVREIDKYFSLLLNGVPVLVVVISEVFDNTGSNIQFK